MSEFKSLFPLQMRPRGVVVNIPPCHGGVVGSNPIGVAKLTTAMVVIFNQKLGELYTWQQEKNGVKRGTSGWNEHE